jgi:DNA repair exonuclease SbcCD ATPase subunit
MIPFKKNLLSFLAIAILGFVPAIQAEGFIGLFSNIRLDEINITTMKEVAAELKNHSAALASNTQVLQDYIKSQHWSKIIKNGVFYGVMGVTGKLIITLKDTFFIDKQLTRLKSEREQLQKNITNFDVAIRNESSRLPECKKQLEQDRAQLKITSSGSADYQTILQRIRALETEEQNLLNNRPLLTLHRAEYWSKLQDCQARYDQRKKELFGDQSKPKTSSSGPAQLASPQPAAKS